MVGAVGIGQILFYRSFWRPSLLHLVKRVSQASMLLVNAYLNSKNIDFVIMFICVCSLSSRH